MLTTGLFTYWFIDLKTGWISTSKILKTRVKPDSSRTCQQPSHPVVENYTRTALVTTHKLILHWYLSTMLFGVCNVDLKRRLSQSFPLSHFPLMSGRTWLILELGGGNWIRLPKGLSFALPFQWSFKCYCIYKTIKYFIILSPKSVIGDASLWNHESMSNCGVHNLNITPISCVTLFRWKLCPNKHFVITPRENTSWVTCN